MLHYNSGSIKWAQEEKSHFTSENFWHTQQVRWLFLEEVGCVYIAQARFKNQISDVPTH